MNKTIKGLIILALALSANNAGAHTNKTFMQPRNQALVNLPLINTTFAERLGAKIEDRFGGNFEVVGFYGENLEKSKTGKYFGINDSASFTLDRKVTDPTKALEIGNLIHDVTKYNDAIDPSKVMTLKLDPKSITYGVDLAYHQDLSKIVNGMYLKVILPIQRIENDPKMTIVGEGDFNATNAQVVKYFAGETLIPASDAAKNVQVALEKAKINGKRVATGVADIDVALGYNFLKKETYHMGLNIGLTIPTGNEVTGEYMFAPTYGSKHFGLGGGLCADARVWGKTNHNVKVNFAANYRYLFSATEKRTLGATDANWGQYQLLHSTAAAVTPFIPAANLGTPDLDITPGSQVDGIVGLAYNNGGFNFDLGYNMFFKEKETGKVKNGVDITKYAKAVLNSDASADLSALAGSALTAAAVDMSAALTPAQLTHSAYAGLGYAFKNWEYPLMLGLGGKYEFAQKNSAMGGYQGWVKAGLSF